MHKTLRNEVKPSYLENPRGGGTVIIKLRGNRDSTAFGIDSGLYSFGGLPLLLISKINVQGEPSEKGAADNVLPHAKLASVAKGDERVSIQLLRCMYASLIGGVITMPIARVRNACSNMLL